jgi:hypothetical protein
MINKNITMKISLAYFVLTSLTLLNAFGLQIGLTGDQKQAPANEWGTVTYNTQISIGLKNNVKVFTTNQTVQLLVRIKNLSTNEEYGVAVEQAFILTEGLSLVVISPSGKDISPIFGKSDRFSGTVLWVHPNQTDGFCFGLNEICKMDEVGTYKVILKMERTTPDRKKMFEIVSNPLFISVITDK